MILMKVTSRERPYKLAQTVQAYRSLAENPSDMVWLFSFDEDDFKNNESQYHSVTSELNAYIYIAPRTNKITAINSGVSEVNNWDILLNISDDQIPIAKGYDNLIRKHYKPGCSLWFYDGWQNRINTQEILSREYYEMDKYIYNPAYKSFFCDNESTEVAKIRRRLIKVDKCIIKHFHPGWDASMKGVTDNLYNVNNKFWEEDKKTFNERKARGFK